jgi:hypothetical protein
MIGTLYRYLRPQDSTRFIYVGQGPKRDNQHRSGRSSFGRRFKAVFPDVVLPQPIKEQIEISSQIELNEEEIIWMFRFHTWRGYPDGMNLTIPGSQDYKSIGRISGAVNTKNGNLDRARNLPQAKIAQRKVGRKAAESGQIQAIGKKYNFKNLEKSRLISICSKAGTISSFALHLDKNEKGKSLLAVKAGKSTASIPGHMKKASLKALCARWNIRRDKPCTCGKH